VALVPQQVRSADPVICQSIASLEDHRRFISQAIFAQFRNLVEGLIIWSYLEIDPAASSATTR